MKFSLNYALGAVCAGALALVVWPAPSQGDTATDLAIMEELAAQQTKLSENQVKIDEKIALIAEEVRQARLFVARGGGKK